MTITDQALVAAANLADRYISDRHLPDKAIDLIDEAGSRLHLKRMDIPTNLLEIDAEIDVVATRKQQAVESQDFEEASRLRDREKELLTQREAAEAETRSSGVDLFDEVDEEGIAEVLSVWDRHPRLQAHRGGDRQAPSDGDRVAQARRRQNNAIGSVSQAIRRTRAGLKTRSGPPARSSSSARRGWARPNWPRRSPSSSSATTAR